MFVLYLLSFLFSSSIITIIINVFQFLVSFLLIYNLFTCFIRIRCLCFGWFCVLFLFLLSLVTSKFNQYEIRFFLFFFFRNLKFLFRFYYCLLYHIIFFFLCWFFHVYSFVCYGCSSFYNHWYFFHFFCMMFTFSLCLFVWYYACVLVFKFCVLGF